jgi:hypothetical protein
VNCQADVAKRGKTCFQLSSTLPIVINDLAIKLTLAAQNRLFNEGVSGHEVLGRVQRGLIGEDAGLSVLDAQWMMQHLAELLG